LKRKGTIAKDLVTKRVTQWADQVAVRLGSSNLGKMWLRVIRWHSLNLGIIIK
jgi:hypothetical protein